MTVAPSRLLQAQGAAAVWIAFVTWLEFAEGFGDDERVSRQKFLSGFQVLWPDADTAWRPARVSRTLRASGAPIVDHDLWIAALALQHGHGVVSRNERHFKRVADLAFLTY